MSNSLSFLKSKSVIFTLLVSGCAGGPLTATEVNGVVHVKTAAGHPPSTVIVYAETLDEHPPIKPGRFEIIQKEKTFIPHVLAVPVGSTVEFPNSDPIFHNVFSLSSPAPFDLGLYRSGTSKDIVFKQPAVYRVFCNIHPQMTALLLVLPTSWIAQPNGEGAFRFNLPAGRYRLTAWSERAAPATAEVTVGSASATVPAMTLDESAYVEITHKNKYGQEYPRSAYEQTKR